MIIKKFTAKTEEQAVQAARKELGDSLVVMNVKDTRKKGFFGFFSARQVEVTVALEEDQTPKPPVPGTLRQSGEGSLRTRTGLHTVTNSESIEKKLDSLQILLESQMKKQEEEKAEPQESAMEASALEPSKTEDGKDSNSEEDKFLRLLYNTMLENEVAEKYANQILEELDRSKKPNMPIDYMLANVYQKMILKFGKAEGIVPGEKGPRVVLMMGPTGVGKTTSIAKLASVLSVEEKKKVALLTSDTYRIAATEQMRVYANILEVPFRVIYTEEELVQAVSDFSTFDYIFVDTSGHSHQNNELLEKTGKLLEALKEKAEYQVFLVLSASTKYRDLLKIVDKYGKITDYQLIFTKLDETDAMGNLLNLKLYTEVPIAYVACGQNVPEDIETFNPQKIVKQLLGGKALNS